MPEAANYTVVLQGDITLPDRNNTPPDVDFEYPLFNAPRLSTSTSNTDRPYLLFSVDAIEDDCEFKLNLNGSEVFAAAFEAGNVHSVNEIIDANILQASGNELKVRSTRSGQFKISDMTAVYKVNI
jgi:hypothetical protein